MSRSRLHKSKLMEFRKWLESRGYSQESTKGVYEVLRMRFDKKNLLLVYTKNDSKQHYTTHGLADDMLDIWFNEKKRASKLALQQREKQ